MISSALFAAIPLIFVISSMVILHWSAFKALFSGLLLSSIIGFFIWEIPAIDFAASALSSSIRTLDIFLIIFGAVFLFEGLQIEGRIDSIVESIKEVSPSLSIQILLLAWGLVAFFEGVAGFGTPAAIVAPILMILGIPPVTAVVLALLGDSAAVVFGAVGTPIIGGYGNLKVSSEPIVFFDLLQKVSVQTALLNVVFLSFMPVIMMGVYERSQNRSFSNFKRFLPLALLSGLLFTLAQLLCAYFLGPEIPSALAAFTTLLAFFIGAPILRHESIRTIKQRLLQLSKTWSPYLTVLFILLVTRLPFLPFKEILMGARLHFENVFGTSQSVSWRPFMNPGLMPFLPIALIFCHSSNYSEVLAVSWKRLYKATPVLFFGIFMVGIMNLEGGSREPMIITLAQSASLYAGQAWYFIAPFIGALGSFVSGSATVSNIMFGNFQLSTAQATGLSASFTLALQSFGGAIGNLICLHNIVAALAVTGHSGQEAKVLRITLPIVLILAFLAGFLSWLFMDFLII